LIIIVPVGFAYGKWSGSLQRLATHGSARENTFRQFGATDAPHKAVESWWFL
jgi:hypothetical protein